MSRPAWLEAGLLVFCFGVSFAGPGLSAPTDGGNEVVAKLGTAEVTAASLRAFVRSLDPAVREKALADPNVMNQAIREALVRMALLNEASARKWDQKPDVAAKIAQAREDVIVSTFLASEGTVPESYPSDSEIRAAYDANKDRFLAPRQYRLEQIFVALPPAGKEDRNKAELAARAKADDAARKARVAGAKFDELALALSDKIQGEPAGDLGWAAESQIVPEIRAQIAGLEVGGITEPIRTEDGFHVIRLADTKPAGTKPVAEVRDQIVSALRQKKAQENQQAYLSRLLQKTPAMINEPAMKRLFESTR